jgi:hypothetical protein
MTGEAGTKGTKSITPHSKSLHTIYRMYIVYLSSISFTIPMPNCGRLHLGNLNLCLYTPTSVRSILTSESGTILAKPQADRHTYMGCDVENMEAFVMRQQNQILVYKPSVSAIQSRGAKVNHPYFDHRLRRAQYSVRRMAMSTGCPLVSERVEQNINLRRMRRWLHSLSSVRTYVRTESRPSPQQRPTSSPRPG